MYTFCNIVYYNTIKIHMIHILFNFKNRIHNDLKCSNNIYECNLNIYSNQFAYIYINLTY